MTRLLPQPTATERTHRKGEEKLFVLRTRLQASTIQFSAQLEWNYCELPIPPLGIVPTGFRGLCHSGRPPSEGVREALYSPPSSSFFFHPPRQIPLNPPLLTLSPSPERKRGKKRKKSHTGRWKGGGEGGSCRCRRSFSSVLRTAPSRSPPLSREDVEHGRRRPSPSSACEPCTYTNVVVASFRDAPCPRKDGGGGGGAQERTAVVWMGDLGGKGRAREMPHFPAGKLYERTKAHILSPVGRERECG